MARTFFMGFESNMPTTRSGTSRSPDGGNAIGTGVTFDASARSGAYALKVAPSSGVAGYYDSSATTWGTGYVRFYLRVTALPASLARVIVGAPGGNVNLRLNANGTISYYNAASLIGTSATALTDTSRWYRIEFRQANGSGVTVLQIDGNVEVTGSPSSWGGPQVIGANDTVGDTYTAYFDDWSVDDAAFPGDGNVVLLLPTADDTRTNWTAGAGGTTNLFEAVNNLPPAGLASASETDTSNIESGSNTGTATYIATMATYASAGITAFDSVTAIRLLVMHGEDIATGTKTGTVELTANPVVAAKTVGVGATSGFGGDSGAHGAVSDTSTGNQWGNLFTTASGGDIVASPTVTVGTAPKMKIVKTDTTTRVACVCFMGIYVEYIPGLPPELMGRPDGLHGQQQMHQLLAQ